MPERKVKAKVSPAAGLARVFLALAAALSLTACLPEMARNSALFSPKPPPAPTAVAPTAMAEAPPPPTPLAPYGPLEPAAPGTGLLTAAPEAATETYILEAATPFEAAPVAAETALVAAGPPAEAAPIETAPAALYSYQPDPLPQTYTFASGLIDLDLVLAEPFPGRLVTAQAGGHLLAAHGLTAALAADDDEPDMWVEPYAVQETPTGLGLAETDPAPSAGEPVLNGLTVARVKSRSRNGARTTSLLTTAYEQTGRHYKRGGANPLSGFDAAGYTNWVFAREGLALPKSPAGLAAAGTKVTREDLRPGDVLIYRNQADHLDGWHVGIYSGQGNFLHASPKAGVVTETDAFGPQFAPYFLGGRRFFDDPSAAPLSDSQKMAATSTAVKLALTELGPNDKIVRPAPKPRPKAKASPKAAKSKAKKTAKK